MIGVKPLTAYVNAGVIQNPAIATTANLLLARGASTLGARNRVQSVTFAPDGTLALGNGQTLTVGAGRMLVRSGGSGAVVSGAGTIDFGVNAGTIATFGNLDFEGVFTGSAGWSKTGPGTLTLSSRIAPGLPVAVLAGTLRAASPDVLRDTMLTLTAPGRFDLHGASASIGGIAGSGEVAVGTAALTLGTARGSMEFGGTFTGSGAISIVDGGDPLAVRRFSNPASSFAGTITLQSGYLDLNAGRLGTNPIIVNGGGLLLGSSATSTQSFVLNANMSFRGTSGFTVAAPATYAGSGGLVGAIGGNLTVQTPLAYTGETRVHSFTLNSVRGALTGTSALHVGTDGTFLLDDTSGFSGGIGGRLPDAMPLFLKGGGKFFMRGSFTGTSETIGAIRSANLSTIWLVPNTSSSVTLNAASLERDGRGTVVFDATGLGAPGNVNTTRLFLSTPPELIGGGAGSGAETSIIPWAISSDSLLTYSATTGIRRLDPSEFAASPTGVTAPTNNLRLTSQHVLSAPLTVNALVLTSQNSDSTGSLSGSGTLTIASGMLLAGGNFNSTLEVPLNFGSREGLIVFPKFDTFAISGAISGSGGLTISTNGAVLLSGANTFTGPITIDSGSLSIPSIAALGPGNSSITFSGGDRRVNLGLTNAQAATLNRGLILSGTDAGVYSDAQLTLAGPISGPGGLALSGSSGSVVLAGANTYTGATSIYGRVSIPSDAAFGNGGPLYFYGGELLFNFPWITDRPIEIRNGEFFDNRGFQVAWNGPLTGSSNLVSRGSGRLIIRSADHFLGGITVGEGVLDIEGVLGASSDGYYVAVNSGGQLTGSAIIDRQLRVFGTLAPGLDIGTMTTGDLTLNGTATLALAFASATDYDSLKVLGTATLSGSVNLALDLRFDPLNDVDRFLILENDGIDSFSEANPAGRFRYVGNDLDQDEAFSVGAQQFRISYTGGDGNDVVLIATPEPGSAALLVLGSAVLSRRPRRDPTRSI